MGFFSSIGGFLKDTAGSIISAGSSLVGGLLGNSSASSINQSNQNFAREQFEYQKALHQNQLQWRVEDAKKAGLHPLAGIGVQAPSFSPVSASTTPLDYSWIGDLGQSANYGATKAKDRKQQAQMLDLQMRGLELDNEYKQAQIDALKVDTLASSIASNQAWQSPANPTLNAKEPNNGIPSDSSVTAGTSPLLGASRVGNSVLLHINPDISDSLTEDMTRNLVANIAAEAQMGRIAPEILKHFSQRERDAVARGDAVIEYSPPSQFFFRWKSHMRSRKNPDGSISGKIIF